MTTLRHALKRETSATVFERSKSRPVIILVEPGGIISLRLKGNRKSYSLDLESLYDLAVKKALAAERAAKKKIRRLK
jgi:hypothetical protein